MTEPHDLIIEHLKRIEEQLTRLERSQDEARAELREIRDLTGRGTGRGAAQTFVMGAAPDPSNRDNGERLRSWPPRS